MNSYYSTLAASTPLKIGTICLSLTTQLNETLSKSYTIFI